MAELLRDTTYRTVLARLLPRSPHETHRLILLLLSVPTRRRLRCWGTHDSTLVSKSSSLQRSQHRSVGVDADEHTELERAGAALAHRTIHDRVIRQPQPDLMGNRMGVMGNKPTTLRPVHSL